MKDFSKTIETERLILRKFKLSDANDMFKNYASQSKVTKYLSWETHSNIDVTKNYLESVVLPDYEKKTYRWAIEFKETSEVIGCIDVVHIYENRMCGELGYVLGEKFWNKGIMTEAGKAVVKYLFEEGFRRIEAMHNVDNPASGRVMQKIGMQFEGVMRKSRMSNKGALVDCALYAIVK